MRMPVILNVAYEERNEVKKLGAQFNGEMKRWYVPTGKDLNLFEKWAPEFEDDFTVELFAPLYLVQSKETCWKCSHDTPVYTFACERIKDTEWENPVNDFFVLDYVGRLERDMIEVMHNVDTYFPDYSKQTKTWYTANHCENCYSMLGDHFMHREPQGAFTPLSEFDCRDIKLIELNLEGSYLLDCGFHSDSDGGVIRHHAAHLSFEDWRRSVARG